MTELERRTWRLLRAYPREWRDERGDDLVATVLDLSRDGQRWPSPRTAADLLLSGWTERAQAHRRAAGGWFAAGRRTAGVAAVAVQAALSGALLWDWLDDRWVAGLPVLGAASAITFEVATMGFLVAFVLWLLGLDGAARAVSGVAMASWVVTVVVFQMGLSGYTPEPQVLVAWLYVASLGTWQLWRSRPAAPLAVIALAAAAGGAAATSVSTGFDIGTFYGPAGPLEPGMGSTASWFVSVWGVAALGSLVLAIRDPRAVIASAVLVPVVLLLEPPLVPSRAALGALAGVVLLAAILAPKRLGVR